MKLRIAYVLNTYPQGSHSFIRREIHALERRGITVLRHAMRPAPMPLDDTLNQAEQDKTRYVLAQGAMSLAGTALRMILRRPGAAWSALRLTAALARASDQGLLRHLVYLVEACDVARACRAEKAEHLHAHFGTNSATVAMLAGMLSGLPYSFTVHGPEEFDQPNSLSLGEKIRHSAFTIGISQFGRSQLCRWVAPDVWDRLKVVHCGIEPEVFPSPQPLPETGCRLISIGRFAEQKGQAALIEAMAEVKDSLPGLHLTLVGDGVLREELQAAIDRHALNDSITLTGWLDESRVTKELLNAHALVMPSFAEGLPMVVMEAMAAARPVIATYIAGIPELVTDETGWLVPAGDVGALAKAITTLSETPNDKLTDMGLAGHTRVLQRHDINTEAASLALLFKGSIGTKTG